MKCKIIIADLHQLERAVNDFLAQDMVSEIASITQTQEAGTVTLTIFYVPKEGKVEAEPPKRRATIAIIPT
ncbi:MAG: hypothetical protein QM796_12145 [Chthoniobacteraceae bacterium]